MNHILHDQWIQEVYTSMEPWIEGTDKHDPSIKTNTQNTRVVQKFLRVKVFFIETLRLLRVGGFKFNLQESCNHQMKGYR